MVSFFATILLLAGALLFSLTESQGCDVFVGSLSTDATVFGAVPSDCFPYQLVTGATVGSLDFTIAHLIDTSTFGTLIISGVNVGSTTLNPTGRFIQDSSQTDVLTNLDFQVGVFSYDALGCFSTLLDAAICSVTSIIPNVPIACSHACPSGLCNIASFDCPSFAVGAIPVDPIFLRVSASSSVVPPLSNFSMIEFKVNTFDVFAASNSPVGCNTSTPVPPFVPEFFPICAYTNSPSPSQSPTQSDLPVCDVLVTKNIGAANVSGPGLPDCLALPNNQFVTGASINDANIDINYAVNTAVPDERIVNGVTINSTFLTVEFTLFQSPFSFQIQLATVEVEFFSFDELTCAKTTLAKPTCLKDSVFNAPFTCGSICTGILCGRSRITCLGVNTSTFPLSDVFMRLNIRSTAAFSPGDYMWMSNLNLQPSSTDLIPAATLSPACIPPQPIDFFDDEIAPFCASTVSPTASRSSLPAPTPSFTPEEPLVICNATTSDLRSTNRTILHNIPYDSSCDMSVRAFSPSTEDSVFDIVVPLAELGFNDYAVVTSIEMYVGSTGKNPEIYIGSQQGCDSFRVQNQLVPDEISFTVTCEGDSVERQRFYNPAIYVEGSPLVLMVRILLPVGATGVFVGRITLDVFNGTETRTIQINKERCINDQVIDTQSCECSSCDGSSDTRPSYYAAPFIVDSGGALPKDLPPGPFIPIFEASTMSRRAEVSVNETDPYLSFLFDKDQFVYEYPGLFPQAYTIGSNITLDNDCGVNVHVIPCSGNIQVWLNPQFALDFDSPANEDSFEEVFSCFTVTEADSLGPIPLTSEVQISLLNAYGYPAQRVSQITFRTYVEEGQTNISLSRLYGFEIQRPFRQSPYTGIYIRCDIGTQIGNRDIPNFYYPLFANSSYCQGSDIEDNPFTAVIPMPTFDNPLHAPLIDSPVDSANFRYMSFMAASHCPTLPMCPEAGISFVQEHQYAPDYVGPMFVFPFQSYGPVDSVVNNYTVTFNVDMSEVLDRIYDGNIPELPVDEIDFFLNVTYAVDFFDGPFQAVSSTLTFTASSCELFICDASTYSSNEDAQVDILQGFQEYFYTSFFPVNHYTFSNNVTSCLRQFSALTGYTGNLTDIKITSNLFLIVGDQNATDNILSRVLVHGINFGISRTAEDLPVQGLFTPRNCTETRPATCAACTGTPQIQALYRNTEVELTPECQINPLFPPIAIRPENNHYQPFIGLQIPFSAIPGLQPIDYLSDVPIQLQLFENRLLQRLQVAFVAPLSYILRLNKENLVGVAYLSYCDSINGDREWKYQDSPPETATCADSLMTSGQVVVAQIDFMGTPDEDIFGLYPTNGDNALMIYFPDVYPNETIIVIDITANIMSVPECDPSATYPVSFIDYCNNAPFNFAWTAQNCSLSVPGECLCRGCGVDGVPVGSAGGGVNYLISPVIMTGNLTIDPDTVAPPVRGIFRRSARRALIEESDLFLNEFFNVTQTISPYSGVMTGPNSDGLIGETYVVENNCGVYVHVKNCSSNIQVWVNPAPVVTIETGYAFFDPIEEIQPWGCLVTTDLEGPLSLFPLTGNMQIFNSPIFNDYISEGLQSILPVPVSQQFFWIQMASFYNVTSNVTIDVETVGPYGFEIKRPYGEGLSGIYFYCETFVTVSYPNDVSNPGATQPLFAGKNFCESNAEPTPVPQFSDPPFVTSIEINEGRYAVPALHIFGTPDCPSIPMCPFNQWFFTSNYSYTLDSMGGMYAFPPDVLGPDEQFMPDFEQVAVFKLSDDDFVDFFESRTEDQTLSMIVTVAMGARIIDDNFFVNLFFLDSICNIEACITQTRVEENSDIYYRIQEAVLGVGYGIANTPFRDHVVYLIQFGPECFDRLQTLEDYDKYSIAMTFTASFSPPMAPFSSNIFSGVMLGSVRFFLNESLNDVIAPERPYLYNSIIYTPDATCKRKQPPFGTVCNNDCQVSQIAPDVFSGPNNNISLISPHPNSTSSSYEEVLGIDGDLINNALIDLIQSIDYEYDYGSEVSLYEQYVKQAAFYFLFDGAEYVSKATYEIGGNTTEVYILCQFQAQLLRSFLVAADNTLAFPFIPGGYVSYNESIAQIFASGICFTFAPSDNQTFEIGLSYGFVTSQYEDCSTNPQVLTCETNQIFPLNTAGVSSNTTFIGILLDQDSSATTGVVIDPLSPSFLLNVSSFFFKFATQTALPLPSYIQPGNNATFVIAPNILGVPPGNLTGTGYSIAEGEFVDNEGPFFIPAQIYSRWRFLATPCANESYFPFPYSPSPSPSPTNSLFTRTKSQSPTKSLSPTRSRSPSMSMDPFTDQCCVRDQPLSDIAYSDLCPLFPIFGCSYLDLPARLLPGGVYQVRDHYVPLIPNNLYGESILRSGIVIGGIYLTFTENTTNARFYYLPGTNRVELRGVAFGRLTDGVFGRGEGKNCINTTYPDIFPGLFNFSITMDTALIPIYGEPAAQFAFIVSETSPTPPNQRIPITISTSNVGYVFPQEYPAARIDFGLSDLSFLGLIAPSLASLINEYSPLQFGIALSLNGTHVGTYTGIGGLRYNCSNISSSDPIVNFTRYIACYAPLPDNTAFGAFMFDIEAECNDCPATPTPGLCPIHGVTHTHSQSQSQSQSYSQSQSRSPTASSSSTPFPLGPGPFNQTCYASQQPEIYTKCGVLNSAVFPPDIWLDEMIVYSEIDYPTNSPYPGYKMGLVQFNSSLLGSGQRFTKFWVPAMPGRTSVFVTIYLWSNSENGTAEDYGSGSGDYPFPNTIWQPSEIGLYNLPPQLVVIVGAGDSPRMRCKHVGNIARCNVPFPQYAGYLYAGIGSAPRTNMTINVGFVYVQMLMINGLGFDNTVAPFDQVIAPPNCVMLNISVGTPHNPACNLAWGAAVPALGSDAYSYTVASTVTSILVMGGVSTAAVFGLFWSYTKKTGALGNGVDLTGLSSYPNSRTEHEMKRFNNNNNRQGERMNTEKKRFDEGSDDDDDDDGEVVELSAYEPSQ